MLLIMTPNLFRNNGSPRVDVKIRSYIVEVHCVGGVPNSSVFGSAVVGVKTCRKNHLNSAILFVWNGL